MKRPAAFLFDMDDTLVATSDLWWRAAANFLRSVGREWSPEMAALYRGMNVSDIASAMHRRLALREPPEECRTRLRGLLAAAFEEGPIVPMPGADSCLRHLHRHGGAPLAVASGSPVELIGLVLERFGWRGCFDAVISSESVPRGKPSPDVFLAAARALGAPPAECLVFEDSLVGVQAALAAGMPCFAVPSSRHAEIETLATATFGSLEEIVTGGRNLPAWFPDLSRGGAEPAAAAAARLP